MILKLSGDGQMEHPMDQETKPLIERTTETKAGEAAGYREAAVGGRVGTRR